MYIIYVYTLFILNLFIYLFIYVDVYFLYINFYFILFIKVFMLDITMQIGISTKLTPNNKNNHLPSHEKCIIKKNKKIWRTIPKLIC